MECHSQRFPTEINVSVENNACSTCSSGKTFGQGKFFSVDNFRRGIFSSEKSNEI